jgi:hypothetical protein
MSAPVTGRLLATITSAQTRVDGIVGADPDLVALAGTVKEAKVITVDSVDKLERAVVEAVQSGKRVADGYVKFARPIVINSPKHLMAKTASHKTAACTIEVPGLAEFIEKLASIKGKNDKAGIEKAAACDFVENWLKKVELDKVDGSEVGLTAPVKVAFSDDKAKEWFLSLFAKKASKTETALGAIMEKLIAAGVNKSAALGKSKQRKG